MSCPALPDPIPPVVIKHPFEQARDEFLSSLAEEDRVYYSPCASATDLETSVKGLSCFVEQRLPNNRILDAIKRLNEGLEPYFKVVEILISSHPECAALVWGSLRLIFQLAANFTGFFDQLASLLNELSRGFDQYDMIWELCSEDLHARRTKIPHLLETVYRDLLHIFHVIIRVFTKRNSRLKKTTTVFFGLLWKPFDTRFKEVLENLKSHRKSLFAEINIWHVNSTARERARTAAFDSSLQSYHDLGSSEMAAAKEERELCQKARDLMDLERRESSSAREETRSSLFQIQDALQKLQCGIFELNNDRMKSWLSPPEFTDSLDRARSLRKSDTGAWIFDESKYQLCLEGTLDPASSAHQFGSNVLWIHGNPGAGKTVLASSIIDNLNNRCQNNSRREVYYYFFEHKSTSNNSARSAYRALLAQLLSNEWNNEYVLDKFSLMMYDNGRNQNQLHASESILVDLLRLCLSSNSILVLDGIDECEDGERFISSLTEIWETHSPYIILMSRVYVAGLQRYIPRHNRLDLTGSMISSDIQKFCDHEVQQLFEEQFLPHHAKPEKDSMVVRMVTGADGMFLWARLMINFLRSPYLYPNQRVDILSQVNSPEGIEAMYDRIVDLIQKTGTYCENLASMVLSRLVYAAAPISSRQIHQALVAEGLLKPDIHHNSESLKQFEDSVIMACTGLVEGTILTKPDFLCEERSLRLIHLSISEMMANRYARPSSLLEHPPMAAKLIPDVTISSLDLATNCIKQILFHTPAQPLSESISGRTNARDIYQRFCFSDYAAVCWLLYLQKFLDAISPRNLTPRNFTVELSLAIAQFMSCLETFLRSPRALSVWLEIFYTTDYPELDPMKYGNPSVQILQRFVLWARNVSMWSPSSILSNDLIESLDEFSAELHDVLDTWGDSLRKTPETVWDEMTQFLRSCRFFWSSGSTRVSYQQPMQPSHATAQRSPTALLSRTSESGSTKAVLSIWGNACFQDARLKDQAWLMEGGEAFNLTELCTGWSATYELWRLQPETALIGRFQISLPSSELLEPMRNFLYQRHSTEAYLPISIHSDLTTFAILRNLFSAIQAPNQPGYCCVSCPLPSMVPQSLDFSWRPPTEFNFRPDTYSTSFGSNRNHVALLEWCITGYQYVTVYEYTRNVTLELKRHTFMDFSPGIQQLERVVFHPRLPILCFCAFSKCFEFTGWQNCVYVWSYFVEPAELFKLDRGVMFESVGYSQCGAYFIVRRRNDGSHVVIPIPSKWLHSTDNVTYDMSNFEGPQRDSSIIPSTSSTAQLSFPPSGLPNSNQVLSVNHNGDLSRLQVLASSSEIQLSSSTFEGSQAATLVTLPMWSGASETSQRIFLPQFNGDSLKISVDVDTQNLSTYSSYQLSKAGGNVQPSFIERDPRFVMAKNPMVNLPNNTLSGLQIPYRETRNKRGYIAMDMDQGESSSASKQRRYN